MKRDREKRGGELKLLDYAVPARVNESTPAAHVLSVCAYFPNLDMGSELPAPRVYVKLAWLSPFRSPHLAVAQRGDAPRHWDYRLQIASCLKLAPAGLAGPKGALVHLVCPDHAPCPRGEQGREEESATVAPFLHLEDVLHPPCALALVWGSFLLLCCYHHLAEEQLPPRMGICFKTGEQLYGAGPMGPSLMLADCPNTWGEGGHFSPLGDKVRRATWALSVQEEKLQFLQPTSTLSKIAERF